MTHTIDSLDVKGFRKAHLRQLAFCVHIVTQQGIGYGPIDQFNKRQAELEVWADEILELCNDPDLRIATQQPFQRKVNQRRYPCQPTSPSSAPSDVTPNSSISSQGA